MTSSPELREFRASLADVGVRIDIAMAGWLDQSRSRAAKLLDAGQAEVNGVPAARSTRLQEGDRVHVRMPVRVDTPPPPVPPICWEDEDLLVLDKPAGLVVHPGSGRPDGTLVDALRAANVPLAAVGDTARPGIVHRLDRGTSGLMLVAKTDAAHIGLSAALRAREIERRYLTVAAGRLPAAEGTIDVPLGRDPSVMVRFVGDHDGKRAVTHWDVRDEHDTADGPLSLVACRLETGRTHQIRAHLRHVRAPVVGDTLYDGPGTIADDLVVGRPMLHAARVAFTHPVTGKPVTVAAGPPDDMVAVTMAAGLELATASDLWTS